MDLLLKDKIIIQEFSASAEVHFTQNICYTWFALNVSILCWLSDVLNGFWDVPAKPHKNYFLALWWNLTSLLYTTCLKDTFSSQVD